jgi:hypothetical protein
VEHSDWVKLRASRDTLRAQLEAAEEAEIVATARKLRLRKQLALVDRRQDELCAKELALIAQLEEAERKEAEQEKVSEGPTMAASRGSSPSAPGLGVSSFLADFDWSQVEPSFLVSDGTGQSTPGNPSGS